jgi:hypothetical protein
VGFTIALNLRLRCSFVSPSYPSRPSSHSGRTVGSQPISFILTLTSIWIQL